MVTFNRLGGRRGGFDVKGVTCVDVEPDVLAVVVMVLDPGAEVIGVLNLSLTVAEFERLGWLSNLWLTGPT